VIAPELVSPVPVSTRALPDVPKTFHAAAPLRGPLSVTTLPFVLTPVADWNWIGFGKEPPTSKRRSPSVGLLLELRKTRLAGLPNAAAEAAMMPPRLRLRVARSVLVPAKRKVVVLSPEVSLVRRRTVFVLPPETLPAKLSWPLAFLSAV